MYIQNLNILCRYTYQHFDDSRFLVGNYLLNCVAAVGFGGVVGYVGAVGVVAAAAAAA